MNNRLLLLSAVLIGFGALTVMALLDVGYFGLIELAFQTWGGAQVFIDLVIVAALACLWMIKDARRHGANAWPFVVITCVAGSFGPLSYLIVREWRLLRHTRSHIDSSRSETLGVDGGRC